MLALLFLADISAVGDYCWFLFSGFLVGVTELSLIWLLGSAADVSLIAGSFLPRAGFLFLAGKVITLGAYCCCIVAGSMEWGYCCCTFICWKR